MFPHALIPRFWHQSFFLRLVCLLAICPSALPLPLPFPLLPAEVMWLQLLGAIASFQLLCLLTRRYSFDYWISEYSPPHSRDTETDMEGSFGCGEIKNISYPFKLQQSNSPGFELICQNHTTLLINLTLYVHPRLIIKESYQRPPYLGIYQVKKVDVHPDDPENSGLEIADLNFASNDLTNSFCGLPHYSTYGNLLYYLWGSRQVTAWVRCRKDDGQLDHSTYLHLPCADNNYSSSSEWHIYLLSNYSMPVQQMDRSCQLVANMPTTYNPKEGEAVNLTAVWSHLQMGFPVAAKTLCRFCNTEIGGRCPAFCYGLDLLRAAMDQLKWAAYYGIVVFAIVPRMLGLFFLAALLIHKLKRKYSSPDNAEQLLQACQNLMPRRYSYPEIKIITGHFREKLGQGGFGSVFKGCLFDHSPVAVKLLGKAKNEGQDFINEVATIGRIHHVNIIRLLGFCSEGRTRALVYEFMPNGSLDKYIFPGNGRRDLLSWEMLYKIALGVARGIEYLHGGCDMCILHFDIKPHNVLLDENFCPKISDFGLARLSPTQNTMILSGYRGTIGYIAPEQASRNFGGVSYKSDVYSFGMLLLQMAGRAKNSDVLAPGSSQIYLPQWIFDRLSEGQDADIGGQATVTEVEIVKKLALVGLCCIQKMPANRPSMSQVIEMLEGRLDALQLPPKPFFLFPGHEMSDEEGSPQSICKTDEEEVSSLFASKWPASSSYSDI